jgi:hypothetical protein
VDAGVRGARETYDQDMTVIEDIIESIENRLCELNEEIGALTAARDALDGRGSRAPTRRRRETATGKTRTGPGNDASGSGPLHGAVEPAGPASTAAPGRPHSKVRKPVRRSARASGGRSVEVVGAGNLERLLSDTGGLATSELADRVDADRDRVLTMLRELEMAGRVRRTGQRRSTRWHTITDGERIQERAAELAARSKSAA